MGSSSSVPVASDSVSRNNLGGGSYSSGRSGQKAVRSNSKQAMGGCTSKAEGEGQAAAPLNIAKSSGQIAENKKGNPSGSRAIPAEAADVETLLQQASISDAQDRPKATSASNAPATPGSKERQVRKSAFTEANLKRRTSMYRQMSTGTGAETANEIIETLGPETPLRLETPSSPSLPRTRRPAFSVEATTLLVQRRRKESLSSASLIDLPARAGAMNAQMAKQAALERSKRSGQNAGEDAEQVVAILQRHKLFASLSRVEISGLVQTMEHCIYEKGDLIIEQCATLASDPCLYVVLSGEADMVVHGKFEEQLVQLAFVKKTNSIQMNHLEDLLINPDMNHAAGNSRTVNPPKKAGDVFGEISCIYDTARTSDVVARTELHAWCLNRKVLFNHRTEGLEAALFLRQMPLFQRLNDNSVIQLALRLTARSYKRGDVISMADGEKELILIVEGPITEYDTSLGSGERRVVLQQLSANEFIGERSVLTGLPMHTLFEASESTVKVLVMSRADVIAILPLIQPVLDDHMKYLAVQALLPFALDTEVNKLVEAFKEEHFSKKQRIVAEGTEMDKLYVVKHGEVQVMQSRSDDFKLPSLSIYDCFGDTMLKPNATYSTSLQVVSDKCVCLVLSKELCMEVVGPLDSSEEDKKTLEILKQHPMTCKLAEDVLEEVARRAKTVTFGTGEAIITQGDEGDAFYILHKGAAVVTKKLLKEDKYPVEVMRVQLRQHFGERALLTGEVRAASVIASTKSAAIKIMKHDFLTLLAPLKGALERQVREVEGSALELEVSFCDLEQLRVIGAGMFGQVKMVKHRFTGCIYALKTMRKDQIVRHGQQEHVKNERQVMKNLAHWSCVSVKRCYRDKYCLYVLLEMIHGGELFRYLDQKGRLQESVGRFYAAQVILALDHLHAQGTIYRDLKPENLLIDPMGYLKMVDFGFAKKVGNGKTYTICGTPDYQAPEVILRKGHGKAADCWSMGILIYEMLAGHAPFKSKADNPRDTFRNILQGVYTIPMYISDTAADIIMQLLQHEPGKRLGSNGLKQIKRHAFFDAFDWEALEARKMTAPYIPAIKNDHDTSNFDTYTETVIPPSEYDDTANTPWDDWDQACKPPTSSSSHGGARTRTSSSSSKPHHHTSKDGQRRADQNSRLHHQSSTRPT